jgi:hypothetical protein
MPLRRPDDVAARFSTAPGVCPMHGVQPTPFAHQERHSGASGHERARGREREHPGQRATDGEPFADSSTRQHAVRRSPRGGATLKKLVAMATLGLLLTSCGSGSGDTKAESISHVHGLGIDPGHPNVLFVATHFGLYVRQGTSWSRRSEDKDDHMGFTLSAAGMWRSGHPESGGSLGVQRSTDDGRTWKTTSSVSDPPVDFHAMTVTRDRTATLYGWDSGGRGIFRSADGGKQWDKLRATGLPNAIGALAAPTGDVVYATTSAGLFRSSDGGQSWKQVTKELLFALAAGSDPDELFASQANGPGVMRSDDGGKTWSDVGSDLDLGTVVALAADGREVVVADQQARLAMSYDGGKTWTRVQNRTAKAIASERS